MSDAVLGLRGVTKSYGERTVLNGIDLDVAEHQVVVLIGASGSGKSTLLRCIDLLDEIDDGQILLDGRDISDPRVDGDEVRRSMAMVFQSFNLFPHMSVLDNITLAPRVVHGRNRGEAEQRGRELLTRVGLGDRADAYPDRLSGGQQQRVAIARALAYDPRVLLLDEVTSALDPELVKGILALIADLGSDGMTMVVVTHEMGFAKSTSDAVVFMDHGKVVESGPPEQIFDGAETERLQRFLSQVL